MSDSFADRNLLFGVLALKLDLIDRDQLVAAMNEWATDKSKSLGDILVARTDITDKDLSALETLVASHLSKHDNQPQRCLADEEIGGVDSELVDDILKIGDPEIQASASCLTRFQDVTMETHQQTMNEIPDQASGAAVGASTSSGSRFLVLRPHARGGLGRVLVARDNELAREVALKEIQDKYADDKVSRSQFVLEAEITGSLEHPGVVPVYGLGSYPNGRPYYAMRFIQGESLRKAADRFHSTKEEDELTPGERSVELRALIGRFIVVCNVIEYAYSRGVMHRDIKPDNIMLGKYGETLVVDWGLAARVNPKADPPARAKTVGTPAFMSPEQAGGKGTALHILSDVFCLGATLYYMLTGKPPQTDRKLAMVLDKAKRAEFRRPRELNPKLPKALEAICLRAMAPDRDKRYVLPTALSDDLERWMADEPVTAYAEPWAARMLRWGRRHRTLVATAAVLCITVIAALGIGLVVVKREQLRTERQREEAVLARQLADENAAAARAAQQRAEQEARRADRQSVLALSALKTMVFDLQTKLKDVPAAHRVRRDLLNTAIERLRQVAGTLETDAEANHSLVWAHLDLGDIFLKAGSVDEGDWTLQALKLYERGNAIAQQLAQQLPDDPQSQRDLALSLDKLGDVHLAMGDAPSAEGFHQRSLQINRQRVESQQELGLADRDLAVSHNNLGDVKLRQGDVSGARDEYLASLEIAKRVAANEPADVEAMRNLSVSYDRLGAINLELGALQAAREAYLKCLEINQERAHKELENTKVQVDLAVAHHHVGDVNLQLSRAEQALSFYERSLEICEALVESDPDNTEAQRMLSVSHDRCGSALMQLGELEKARDQFKTSLAINQATAEADPSNTVSQRDLSVSHEKLGDVSLALGDHQAANDAFQEMFAIANKLAIASPDDAQAQTDLAVAHSKLGDAAAAQSDLTNAQDAYQAALAIYKTLAAEDAANVPAQANLAAAYGRLGYLNAQHMQFETAANWFGFGVQTLQSLGNGGLLENQPLFQQWLDEQQGMHQFCKQANQAIQDVSFAGAQPPVEARRLLSLRLAAMMKRADTVQISATAEAIGALASTHLEADPDEKTEPLAQFIQAARASAIAASIVKGDQEPADLNPADKTRHADLLKRVAHWLKTANTHGYFADPSGKETLAADPVLGPLLQQSEIAKAIE